MTRSTRSCVVVLAVSLMGARVSWGDGEMLGPVLTDRVAGETGVASTEQKGIIIELPDAREVALFQTTYHGPAADFAWIIPVPGEPGDDDVFLASTDLIDMVLDTTRPLVNTEIETPHAWRGRSKTLGTAGVEGVMGLGEPGGGPTVTLHRRMEVGDYDVSVLSATGTQVLLDWLAANGYRSPKGHEELIQHYVDKHWYFVALKVLSKVVTEKPVMDDVKPIGIRFSTEQLVYPLYISRGSSREKTALLLVALTEQPVECEQLTTVSLPLERKFRPGTCYAHIRRDALRRPEPAAVREYVGYGAVTARGLFYVQDRWFEEGAPRLDEMWATRLWTLLDREQMVDLTFKPTSAVVGSRLAINRTGRVVTSVSATGTGAARGMGVGNPALYVLLAPALFLGAVVVGRSLGGVPPWSSWLALGLGVAALAIGFPGGWFPVALLIALILVVTIVLARLLSVTESQPSGDEASADPPPKFGTARLIRWMLVCAGAVAVGMSLGDSDLAALFTWSLWGFLFELAWIALAVMTLRDELKQLRPEDRGSFWAVSLLFLAAVLWLTPLSEVFGGVLAAAATGVPVGIIHPLAVLAFAAICGFALVGATLDRPTSRALGQAFAHMLLGLALIMLLSQVRLMRPAHAGMMIARNTGVTQLDSALTTLDEALVAFLRDTGCYPKTLADLTEPRAPKTGLDSSGNEVQLRGEYGGPYLDALPTDTLTGKTDSWVYAVTGTPMIDSGGYTITLTRASTPAKETIVGRQARRNRQYYWGMGVRYPFDTMNDELLTQPPAGLLKRCVMRGERGALLLADLAGHQGEWLLTREVHSGPGSVNVARLSPDATQVAFAVNQQRSTRLSVCDVHYERTVNERGGTLAIPGRNFRRLTPGPWKVEVLDIGWHPRAQKWVVAAQPLEYLPGGKSSGPLRPPPRAFIVDGVSAPTEVPNSQGCLAVRWTQDGKGFLAITGEHTSSYRERGVPRGPLEIITPDGRRKTIADSACLEAFTVNRWGTAVIAEGGGRILYIAPDGERSLLPTPKENLRVEDLWLGDGVLVAAYTPHWPTGHGTTGTCLICVYSPVVSQPKVVGKYRCGSGGSSSRLFILGYDRRHSAALVAYGVSLRPGPTGTSASAVYALRSGVPRSERLLWEGAFAAMKSRQVYWAGERINAELVGCFSPDAFRVGDLISSQAGADLPSSVVTVAAVDQGDLIAGDKRIHLPEDVPTLGETRHYLKLRRVAAE